ncbi:MAG: hypothetical protein NTV87_15330 [Ignavibacteriae bacterium]|nr:hypothetical protein [Ignavibacteriota bacterium]
MLRSAGKWSEAKERLRRVSAVLAVTRACLMQAGGKAKAGGTFFSACCSRRSCRVRNRTTAKRKRTGTRTAFQQYNETGTIFAKTNERVKRRRAIDEAEQVAGGCPQFLWSHERQGGSWRNVLIRVL